MTGQIKASVVIVAGGAFVGAALVAPDSTPAWLSYTAIAVLIPIGLAVLAFTGLMAWQLFTDLRRPPKATATLPAAPLEPTGGERR
jgi:NO-binding membrane sensor protein with MHYT domain